MKRFWVRFAQALCACILLSSGQKNIACEWDSSCTCPTATTHIWDSQPIQNEVWHETPSSFCDDSPWSNEKTTTTIIERSVYEVLPIYVPTPGGTSKVQDGRLTLEFGALPQINLDAEIDHNVHGSVDLNHQGIFGHALVGEIRHTHAGTLNLTPEGKRPDRETLFFYFDPKRDEGFGYLRFASISGATQALNDSADAKPNPEATSPDLDQLTPASPTSTDPTSTDADGNPDRATNDGEPKAKAMAPIMTQDDAKSLWPAMTDYFKTEKCRLDQNEKTMERWWNGEFAITLSLFFVALATAMGIGRHSADLLKKFFESEDTFRATPRFDSNDLASGVKRESNGFLKYSDAPVVLTNLAITAFASYWVVKLGSLIFSKLAGGGE